MFLWCLRLAAALSLVIIVWIGFFLVWESTGAFDLPGALLTDQTWAPGEGRYSLMPMLVGTLLVTLGAVSIAMPVGLCTAVFLRYYAPGWFAVLFRRLIELSAAVPSVVYGFWGLMVLVPWMQLWTLTGQNLFTAVVVLAVMILPLSALVVDAALGAVPPEYHRAGAALALRRWRLIWHVILPSSRASIMTGMVLQTGRALGETMAVLMVCGNIVQLPASVADPVRTLTTNIALEIDYAAGRHRAVLFLSGLVLMVGILVITVLAEQFQRQKVGDGAVPVQA